jgi:hypothetical protein
VLLGVVVGVVVGAIVVVDVAGCDLVASVGSPFPNAGVPTASADVVALAGPDLVVLEGASVTLAGAGSRALSGSPTLTWSQTAGPAAPLSNPSSPTPTFTAPLGPARLVFSLTASVDDERDADEVVVDVVVAGPPARPVVQTTPADVHAADDEPVTLRIPWRGRGEASVRPRCALRESTTVGVEDAELSIVLRPAQLPCAVVVDDDDEALPVGGRANRIAMVIWPEDVDLPEPTRATARAVVDAGALVDIVAPAATVTPFDGTPLSLTADTGGARFTAPRRVGPLSLLAERREGAVSGGTVAVAIAVRAGSSNTAPEVSPVDDLVVRPGARFRIIAQANDVDGDPLTIAQRQVLGDEARVQVVGSDALVAPEGSGTLLFHVTADDGVAESAPVPVRVIVDPAAENRPPELSLPASVFATPGSRVVLDASSARDPDNGVIAAFRVQQEPDDERVVLPAPVDEARFEFVAPEAGAVLRFLLSAYDDGGLGVTVSVTVSVENAGPFVDRARGDDDGDGTAAAPFATIAGALGTAARHRFPALLLAEGVHATFDGALPDGLGLVGGHRFDGATYVAVDDDDGLTTVVPLGLEGLVVTGGDLHRLTLGSGRLRVVRSVALAAVNVQGDIDVAPGSRLTVSDTVVAGVVAGRDAEAAFVRSSVLGGIDVDRISLQLQDCTVEGTPALRARDGDVSIAACDLRSAARGIELIGTNAVVAARIHVDGSASAAAGQPTVGLSVVGGAVTLEDAVVEVSATDVADGIVVDGGGGGGLAGSVRVAVSAPRGRAVAGAAVDLVDSVCEVQGDDVVGVDVVDARLDRTRVVARGRRAVALRVDHGDVRATVLQAIADNDLEDPDATGVVGVEGGDVVLRHATVLAPVAVRADGGVPVLRNTAVVGAVAFDGVVDAGVVGVVGGLPEITACPRCILAPAGAVDDSGHLAPDDLLGVPNPLVDGGAREDAVDADIDGDRVPAGGGPDVGADERPLP